MKPFAFLSKKNSATREQRIPDNRLKRVTQSFQRRLDDDVEVVFNRACMSNDVEAATDLLALMEKWHERRMASYGRERRIHDDTLRRACRALDRLVVLHGAPSVGLDAHFAKTSGTIEADRDVGIQGLHPFEQSNAEPPAPACTMK